MSSSSAPIRSKPMQPSFTVRRTDISTPKAIFTRSATAPATSRSMRSSFLRDDGLYPLPYMARQADGRAWDADGAQEMRHGRAKPAAVFPGRIAAGRGGRPSQRRRARHRQPDVGLCGVRFLSACCRRPVTRRACRRICAPTSATAISRRKPWARISSRIGPPHLGQHPPRLGLARIVNAVQAAFSQRQI